MNIVSATGHRPQSLPSGSDLTPLILVATDWLKEHKPSTVLSGMALGWDQAVAIAALQLGLPVHAYVPFNGQNAKWSKRDCEVYSDLLCRCAKVIVVSPGGYSPEKFKVRNEALVDSCDVVLALWNGEHGSGTGHCVRYAEAEGRPVWNVWEQYECLVDV
jgi:uncharacterized phage-like protein YoqJ